MTTANNNPIDAADLVELGEFCGFLHDWIATDPDTLAPSLRRFSFGLFSLEEIAGDLDRFAWLLNPNDPGGRKTLAEEDHQ
ncbi:MAG: hypothetical protein U5K29_10900 [Acidimicrobiales bacterium]|nr:hypothetical protein [Acidimicrobiales bacterium]MDZ7826264.1 hypothetical protein [Gammaproteobacteria bacterium]